MSNENAQRVSEHDDEIDLLAVLDAMKRRVWWFAASAVVVVSLGLVYVLKQPPKYVASTLVRIQQNSMGTDMLDEFSGAERGNKEMVSTHCEILTSETVLGLVAQKLGADSDSSLTVGSVRKGLEIEPISGTYLVRLQFESHDPELSAKVANLIPLSYMEWQRKERSSSSREAVDWMESETEFLQNKVESQYQQIKKLREGRLSTTSKAALEIQRQEASAQYARANLERLKLENTYRHLKSLATDSPDVASLPPSLVTPEITELHRECVAREQALAEAYGTYKGKHPTIVRLEKSLELSRKSIRAALNDRVKEFKAGYEHALSQEETLRKNLAEVENALASKSLEDVELATLEKSAAATQELHDAFLKKGRVGEILERSELPSFSVIDPAVPPTGPSRPNLLLLVAVLLLGSQLLAGIAAIAAEFLDMSISTPEAAQEVLGYRCLAAIPRITIKAEEGIVAFDTADIAFSEAFKAIDTRIRMGAAAGKPVRRILVTSASPSDGKTFVTAHLGQKIAESDRRVVEIDADFYNHGLSKLLAIESQQGFCDIITGSLETRNGTRKLNGRHLFALGSGSEIPQSSVLSYGNRISEVFRELEREFDVLLIDAPPSYASADVAAIASQTDGVLFVVHAKKSNRQLVKERLAWLTDEKVNILGIVLNNVTRPVDGNYYHRKYTSRKNT